MKDDWENLVTLTGCDLRHLRLPHDGSGFTRTSSFVALYGANPDRLVFTQKHIAKHLGRDVRTVRRQTETGSLGWMQEVNGVPFAHVSSLNHYKAFLDGPVYFGQRDAAGEETRFKPLKEGTLFEAHTNKKKPR